jgi:hypothetical protein
MNEELLKSVRIVQPVEGVNLDGTRNSDVQIKNSGDGVRLDVYQSGKRKYAVLKSPNRYFPDKEDDYKFNKLDRSMSDDDVIKEALIILKGIGSKSGLDNFSIEQMIIQSPWKDNPPTKRNYGFTKYYLNDGSQVHIQWFDGLSPKGSYDDNADGLITKSVTYLPYNKSYVNEGLPTDLRDQSDVSKRDLSKKQRKDGTFDFIDKIENSDILEHIGTRKDSDIINDVISQLKLQISKFNGTPISDNKLSLCDPDTEYCKLIRYVDFNGDLPSTDSVVNTPIGTTQSSDKTKLFLVGLPDKIEIKVGENLPDFSVYVNKIYTPPQYQEWAVIDEEVELDPEYQESSTSIEAEQVLEFKLQEVISNGQEDSDKNLGSIGDPVDIKPVSSFNELIDLAGKCARELGKSSRVNSENMKKGYTKGIHGLCPQGTQAVLYALTGVKAVGQISGNADWFSFGPTNPVGGDNKSSFSKSGYFMDKERIKQINGSWKGTYLDKNSVNLWQVGDVVAMAYNGKSYGHIQVWTGYSWMSDFKQGNSIQQNNVNVDSVALWRLNDKGVVAVKKQNTNLA